MDKEMMQALEADGEKLRQLTGEDHGPFFVCENCDNPLFCQEHLNCWNLWAEGRHFEYE